MEPTTFDPGSLAVVDCHAQDHRWTLVFVRELSHPPHKVWAALTDPAQLSRWAPFTANRDLGEVGDATLTMIEAENPQELSASVRHAEAPTLLEHTWGPDLLRWELAPTHAGTTLTLRHTLEDRDWAAKVAAGWHLCLVVAQHLLDGQPIPPIRGADARNYGWERLADAYAERLAGQPPTVQP